MTDTEMLNRAQEIIAAAEIDLGRLTIGQKIDLLLDNMCEIQSCSQAEDIVLRLE